MEEFFVSGDSSGRYFLQSFQAGLACVGSGAVTASNPVWSDFFVSHEAAERKRISYYFVPWCLCGYLFEVIMFFHSFFHLPDTLKTVGEDNQIARTK